MTLTIMLAAVADVPGSASDAPEPAVAVTAQGPAGADVPGKPAKEPVKEPAIKPAEGPALPDAPDAVLPVKEAVSNL